MVKLFKQFWRDLTIFWLLLYGGLLMLNVWWQNFVGIIFPLELFGWIGLVNVVVYSVYVTLDKRA
ncbi:MAG: hypothetical protein HYV33_01805 [Candidatus Kerfeldbacteria bacterium]|nr:hypothetical protein [Candidatus Kerfeldbacteria bacterium]